MPVVSACVSQSDFQAWDQKYNIKPKSFVQLGIEGHWLLDGLDPEGYRIVVGLGPAGAAVHPGSRFRRRLTAGRPLARWRPNVSAGHVAVR